MNSDMRSNDFATRLRRIEEKRQQAGRTPYKDVRKSAKVSRDASANMRHALIGLVLAIFLGTGGYVAWKLNSVAMHSDLSSGR